MRPHGLEVGRAQSAGTRTTRALRALFLLSCLTSSFAALACVETAECDQSSPCREGGQICYDYQCVTPCGGGQSCGANQECVLCTEAPLCVGDQGSVCVEQQVRGVTWDR